MSGRSSSSYFASSAAISFSISTSLDAWRFCVAMVMVTMTLMVGISLVMMLIVMVLTAMVILVMVTLIVTLVMTVLSQQRGGQRGGACGAVRRGAYAQGLERVHARLLRGAELAHVLRCTAWGVLCGRSQ